MNLSLTIRAHHDEHGKLVLRCKDVKMEVSEFCNEVGTKLDTRFAYDKNPHRNYVTEQAEVLESLYKYLLEVMSYYNGSQPNLAFPDILTPSHLKGTTYNVHFL